ncbi:IS200/IS605 family transposase, partial [Candidatus Woesearchaeota archaeon]|nr:IS200/IS605 family transposase [Candidatus Woesearchaeota archaeon]
MLNLIVFYSQNLVFNRFPILFSNYYWKCNLWGRGEFFRSVGNVTSDVIKNYIN